jgi:hypothetical protein
VASGVCPFSGPCVRIPTKVRFTARRTG